MKKALLPLAVLVGGLLPALGVTPATATPSQTASASAYVVDATLAGNALIETTPLAEATYPPGEDNSVTSVPLDVAPLAINGTLTAEAIAHQASDIPSQLEVDTQDIAGPYNALGVATVEELDVLVDVATVGTSVIRAGAVRAEAAAVCVAGVPQYTATSEILELEIGGENLPLNGPLEDLLGAIQDLLDQTGLADIVNVDTNVITDLPGGGIAVDAIVVELLAVAGDPVVGLTIGHAEVGPLTCAPIAECSDGVDNDGDGGIDFGPGLGFDPDCDSPTDSETPECSDDADNDGDGKVDEADPGCLSGPGGSYNPNDDNELNECRDGADNDGDGKIDFPNDPDCDSADDFETPECSDGRDNDGDGKIDFGRDPGCSSISDDDETDPRLADTGIESGLWLGGGAAGLVLALALLRARRRALLS